jgi:O-antigen/teichoic acid export membrane protein
MGELKQKAIKGVAWSFVDKGCVKLISFAIGIIIARILTPADYGVVGMIMVFIVIANIIVDSGISQALVQRKNRSEADKSTAFFFNVTIACVCYIILFLLAPAIARFYETPILIPVLRTLGINVIIMSLATVQRANLQADLDFRTIAIVNILGVLASGAIGIAMAYTGFGIWAIVFQQIASFATSTVVYWILGKWRPTMEFSMQSFKALWKFGSKLLAAGLVATILREIYTVTIGKIYRASELGYYSRAVQTTDMVALTTNDMINAVTFPILSSLQDDKDKMISVYSRMLGMTAFFIFPIMTLLAVIAEPLTTVLLTDKWLPIVPLMQWLCFARMFTPISALNMNILNAVGRSDLFLKLDLSKLPLTIITMVITIPLGVKAIVIGSFIDTFICYFINAYLPGRMFSFGIIAQFRIFIKIVISTAAMALAAYAAMIPFSSLPGLQLAVGLIAACITYLLAVYTLKVPELNEARIAIRNLAIKIKR